MDKLRHYEDSVFIPASAEEIFRFIEDLKLCSLEEREVNISKNLIAKRISETVANQVREALRCA